MGTYILRAIGRNDLYVWKVKKVRYDAGENRCEKI